MRGEIETPIRGSQSGPTESLRAPTTLPGDFEDDAWCLHHADCTKVCPWHSWCIFVTAATLQEDQRSSRDVPGLSELPLEGKRRPAVQGLRTDEDLDQPALFLSIRESIAAWSTAVSFPSSDLVLACFLQRRMAMHPTTIAGGTEAFDKAAPHTVQTPLRI